MYKTRIKEWHLEKNYKASEKQAVLNLMEEVEPSVAGDINIEIRGRPVKMHRIFRYCKARGTMRANANQGIFLGPNSGDSQAQDLTRNLTQQTRTIWQHQEGPTAALKGNLISSFRAPERPCWPLPTTQEVEGAEQTLFEVSHYFRAYFNPGGNCKKGNMLRSQPFFGQSILSDIIDTYARACREAAISNYRRARILLSRVHRQLHLATRAEHSQLLGMIFTIMNTPSHNPKFETAELFGRFAMDISCTVFGTGHPITKAIQRYGRMSTSVATKDEFVHRFGYMRVKIALVTLGEAFSEYSPATVIRCHTVNDPQYAWLASSRYAAPYHYLAMKTDATSCTRLQEVIYNHESQYEPDHTRLLSILHEWAGFHLRGMNDLRTAKRGFSEVLARVPEHSLDRTAIHARLRALKGLVVIADREGRWNEGEILCREALDLSVKELGHAHYYPIRLAEWLMDLLSQQGRDDEARQVAMDHGLEVEAEL